MLCLGKMLPGLFLRPSLGRLLIALSSVAVLAFSVACSGSGAADEDTYLQDIRTEATRTAELNDRTEALLDHNEILAATATAAYEEFGETQAPLQVLSQDLALLLNEVTSLLSEASGTGQLCGQLTVNRLQSIEGVDQAIAERIRAEFGCATTQ